MLAQIRQIYRGGLPGMRGFFQFPIQALLEERDLGTFINSQDCCERHKSSMVGGTVALLP